MFQAAGIEFLPVYLLAMLAALLMALWALFPSIRAEISPPEGDDANAAAAMGAWLDRGFDLLRVAGRLLYLTLFLPPAIFAVLFVAARSFFGEPWVDSLIAIAGTLVAGAAAGVFGFAGRLKNLAGGLRPLLRTMLDVDDWLREHPRDSNPTARICARYVSLLRHLSSWRDADGRPYKGLVIIAHSQGTVITADLLRFLRVESMAAGSMEKYDPQLAVLDGIPQRFFTMGCPLRQLYGLRFPFLYEWARDDAQSALPDFRPLGLTEWVNAYRTGDYVGRNLWSALNKRAEFAIGPGAHTHYWDRTGGLIAKELDRLIGRAGSLTPPSSRPALSP